MINISLIDAAAFARASQLADVQVFKLFVSKLDSRDSDVVMAAYGTHAHTWTKIWTSFTLFLLLFLHLFPMFTDILYHLLYATHIASVATRDINGHYQ